MKNVWKTSKQQETDPKENQNKKQDVFYETLSPSSMNNLVKNVNNEKQNFESMVKH